MDKTKIQAIKIQATTTPLFEYDNIIFTNAEIQLDGKLKLISPAYGLFILFDTNGLSGTMGVNGIFPDPLIAKYGFNVSEEFNILTMTALRNLSNEQTIEVIKSLLLLKNSEYVDNLKVVVDMTIPTVNEMETYFNNKVFEITAQNDNLVYFCPSIGSYVKFDLEAERIKFLHGGLTYSDIQFDVNYLITTNLQELNNLGASGTPNKIIFEYNQVDPVVNVNKGRNSTVIRRK